MDIGNYIRQSFGKTEAWRILSQVIYQNGKDEAIRTIGENLPVDSNGNEYTINNPFPVRENSFISTVNSSANTLIADEVFTGEWEDTQQFSVILVTIHSNVASAEDGLVIEYNEDIITYPNTPIASDPFNVPANSGKTYSFQPVAKYFRVVYTNGGSGQSFNRLHTQLKSDYVKPSSHRIKDDIIGDDDAELVSNILKVQTNDKNTYKNVDVQNPLPSDGDSIYGKDLDLTRSDITDWTGNISDLFGDLTLSLTYTGVTNPKNITVYFRRTVLTHAVAFTSNSGNFSNLKIIALLGGGTELPMYDGSSDSVDRVSQSVQFSPIGVEGFRFEFHTTDDVTVSNSIIFKTSTVVSRIQATSELTDTVENISSYRSALNVNPAYVHRKIVNETFHQHTGTITNPSSAITGGDITINVDSTTGLAIGSEIKLEEDVEGIGIQEIGLLTITNIAALVITLDRPVGNDYTTAATVAEVISNMATAVGTLASPQIYEIDPPLGTIWQFTRILISIIDNVAPDDGKFGGIAALTNGVSLRATTSAGRTVVFANWKTNGDMKLDMFNVEYSDRAPAGAHGVNGRWTFTTAEVVAELDGDASPIQKLEILVQDDISANISFKVRGQGRVFSP